jgi:hypothetical protein
VSEKKKKFHEKEYCGTLKNSMKELYGSYDKVFCPILNKNITFNSIGFRHLIYKPDGTARNTKEVIYKLTLLPLAIPTIKNSVNIIDERDVKIKYNRKKNGKIKKGKTYAISAVVGKNRIKVRVIILILDNSKPIFYSIMKK